VPLVDCALDETLFGVEHLGLLRRASWAVLDSETTGLRPVAGGLRLLQLAAPGCPVVVVDLWACSEADLGLLRAFLRVPRRWYAHNAVFDLGWLQENHFDVGGEIFCTMLASRLLENGRPNIRNGLQPVLKRYLDIDISKEQQKSDWSAELSEKQLAYAANDVRYLVELVGVLRQRIKSACLEAAWALECRAIPAIAQMQRVGIPFSRTKLEELKGDLEEQIGELGEKFVVQLDRALPEEHKIPRDADGTFNLRAKDAGSVRLGTKVYAGFNMNSPKQLVEKFAAVLGTVPVDSDNKPSASRKALRTYAADHEVVQVYLEWKRAEKRRQMVVSMLEHQAEDGFIRANYLQLGADTGRMSCREPNNQQIPRDARFRAAAEAPDGWIFVCADYGQMELRLAAAISKDDVMIRAFQDNQDLHTLTAAAIYPTPAKDAAEEKMRRQVAKSANFGLLFASGAKGLREYAGSMGITMTLEEAEQIRDTFHGTYQGISAWQKASAATADKSKSSKWADIRIPISGLRRYLLGDMNRVTTRCNTPVQGSGAAIMKLALSKLWPHLKEA
jgi:DNA polymerase I-like protein with 3'-5' exonuclease and polymerase domains